MSNKVLGGGILFTFAKVKITNEQFFEKFSRFFITDFDYGR